MILRFFKSGAFTKKLLRKSVYICIAFGFFILGSFVSLSTLDPTSCNLDLCTRRLQNMDEYDSNQWLSEWNKRPARGQPKKVFLVIAIITAPSNFELRNVIRQTWLNEETSDTLHYFVIGTEGLSEDVNTTVESEQKRFSDLLLLPNVKDSYSTLTKKVLATMVYINQNVQFRFLLKCDDDSYVQLNHLQYELKEVPYKQRVYWGFFNGNAPVFRKGPWAEDKFLLCDKYLPYANGGGYILSHDLVTFIASNSLYLQLYKNEDVSVGIWLAPLELHRIHDTKFDTEYKTRGCHNDYIITHKQTISNMREKYNHISAHGVLCRDFIQLRKSYNYNWNVPPSKCCIRNDSSIP